MKTDEYLSNFRQSKLQCWAWRGLMMLAFVSTIFGLIMRNWHAAANAFIIVMFSVRICALEQYITGVNAKRDHDCKPTESTGE